MKLTDPEIKAAKPREKPYSLPDGHGLVLFVQPSGAKWWRYRYRFIATAKMLSMGVYPDVTLKEARYQLAHFKELLSQGIDPSQHRQEQKQLEAVAAENSFESIARLWWVQWSAAHNQRHANYVMRRLEADIFPIIGRKPVTGLTAPMLLMAIKKIESRGALDIAKRALTTCNQIMRYAVAHGLAERNPAADIKPSDVLKPTKKTIEIDIDSFDQANLLLTRAHGMLDVIYTLENASRGSTEDLCKGSLSATLDAAMASIAQAEELLLSSSAIK